MTGYEFHKMVECLYNNYCNTLLTLTFKIVKLTLVPVGTRINKGETAFEFER